MKKLKIGQTPGKNPFNTNLGVLKLKMGFKNPLAKGLLTGNLGFLVKYWKVLNGTTNLGEPLAFGCSAKTNWPENWGKPHSSKLRLEPGKPGGLPGKGFSQGC